MSVWVNREVGVVRGGVEVFRWEVGGAA